MTPISACYTLIRMQNKGLREAVYRAGGVVALARRLNITRACIYQWDKGLVPIPRMFEIEEKLRVNRRWLRPDLFEGINGESTETDVGAGLPDQG